MELSTAPWVPTLQGLFWGSEGKYQGSYIWNGVYSENRRWRKRLAGCKCRVYLQLLGDAEHKKKIEKTGRKS